MKMMRKPTSALEEKQVGVAPIQEENVFLAMIGIFEKNCIFYFS